MDGARPNCAKRGACRGADPFAATRYDVTAHAAELVARYAGLAHDGDAPPEAVAIAGRLMSVRKMGKGAVFADLWDRSGRLQIVFAGKAHPADNHGKEMIKAISQACRDPELRSRME